MVNNDWFALPPVAMVTEQNNAIKKNIYINMAVSQWPHFRHAHANQLTNISSQAFKGLESLYWAYVVSKFIPVHEFKFKFSHNQVCLRAINGLPTLTALLTISASRSK